MNIQEVFDTVATHLLTQKERSVNEYNKCMYRGDGGKMCAVGVLIPDESYDDRMEFSPVESILERYDALMFLKPHMSILSELQTIHDYSDPRMWLNCLESLAFKYKLKTNVLEQLAS
jgi:hypothetical protein